MAKEIKSVKKPLNDIIVKTNLTADELLQKMIHTPIKKSKTKSK